MSLEKKRHHDSSPDHTLKQLDGYDLFVYGVTLKKLHLHDLAINALHPAYSSSSKTSRPSRCGSGGYLLHAAERGGFRLDNLEAYSILFYVKEQRVELAHLSHKTNMIEK